MKKFYFTLLATLFLTANCVSYADELKVTVGVENGTAVTKIIGADIYATIDGKLTEITVLPDKLPFKMNFKAGALRIKSFWATDNQQKNTEE